MELHTIQVVLMIRYLLNIADCDSVHTLVLTINNSTTGTSSETACNSYDWNGTTYNTSGSYDQVFTNIADCDSVHTFSRLL